MSFKLDLKVKRAKTRLTRDKPGASTLRFEGCADIALWSAISVKAGNGDLCGSKDTRVIDVLETTQVHENGDVGIKASPPQGGVGTNSPAEVPLHQYTQQKQQTGAENDCAAGKVPSVFWDFPSWKHGGMAHTTRVLQWTSLHSSERISKEGEAAEITNGFFASVLISKTSCFLGTPPSELEDRDQEKNRAPIIQREMVSDLTDYLDIHKSMGAGRIQPRVLRDVAEVFTEIIFSIYQQSQLIQGGPGD